MGSMSPMNILGAGLQGLTKIAPILNTGAQLARDIRNISGQNDPQRHALRDMQAQQNLALQQMIAQQELGARQAADDAALERARLGQDAAAAEDARRAALKRAVARQKVSLASQGVSSVDSGSAEAILLGMFQETENDRTARARLDGLREQAIGQGLAQRQALNVLQRSQLEERQRLERELLR